MKWLAKALVLKALSVLPGGSRIYDWGQKHVTHSLDATPERVRQKIEVALLYLDTLSRLDPSLDLATMTHMDFGAGWHPTIPLFLHACGCERQWLFDAVPLLDAGLLEETLATFQGLMREPTHPFSARAKRIPTMDAGATLDGALEKWGMTYVAPCRDKLRGMSECVDLVTSTQVLFHVRRDALHELFCDLFRALKSGACFLATIHLRDLHANLGGISKYNHLRYSPAVWDTCVNSRLISYNRLKAPDYRVLLESAGFTLPLFEVEPGTAEDLAELDRLRIHPSFARYSREDLAARHLFFVARKP